MPRDIDAATQYEATQIESARILSARTLQETEAEIEQALRAAKPSLHNHAALLPLGTKLHGGRIEVVRQLGSGAMGTVYEATDGGARIALKTLNHLQPDQLYRLKREFRFLTEVMHPNVVVVYELLVEGDVWFFTMECVNGLPLHRYWALQRSHGDTTTNADHFSAADIALLYRLLRQIADGVCAIHDVGLLHRDLKPNNILVEPGGRVVILDFSLVSDQIVGGVGQTIAHQISGTPGFMSPEQAAGVSASTASDWYAVGVILYQLLTRKLPYDGTLLEVLRAKQTLDIVPPRALIPAIPAELDALCCALLRRDPAARPSSAEMRAFSRDRASVPPRPPGSSSLAQRHDSDFIGRAAQLGELSQLYDAAQTRPVFALVRAESGMGKSELLRRFIDSLQHHEQPFIVRGHCHEHEAVPYKALDEAIDDLTRVLMRLPEEQAHQLVPRHAHTLARLFPVLRRVPAFGGATSSARTSAGDAQLRRLGAGALRELLARISDQRPLVLVLDDLHWSDVDSVQLLTEVLAPPDAPNLFILGSCRSQYESRALTELLALPGLLSARIDLPPLAHAEAFELALSLLPGSHTQPHAAAERIAEEAAGNPLYVLEAAAAREHDGTTAAPSLERLLGRRIEALPEATRAVLELVALTPRPLPRDLLMQACGDRAHPTALSALRAAKLVHRSGAAPHEEAFEAYHDRVRAAVVAGLDPERRRQHHDALACALAASERDEPEWLAHHLKGAGRLSEAHRYALQAARKAHVALAFNRAADLFALAIELLEHAPAARLHHERGHALACAGRGVEAAEAYLLAANASERDEALQLEALAAAQLLRLGHIGQAVSLLKRVLAQNGLAWPESYAESMARFLYNRARIRLSGLKFELRAEGEVAPELLRKLGALYPAQTALGTFDYLRGACFASMALPLALQAGEPKRLITALASEAVYNVMLDGSSGFARAREIQTSIDVIANTMPDPYGSAVAELTTALSAYWSGRWARVRAASQKAEELFCERVADGTWEQTLVRSVRHTVEIHAGALPDLAREIPSALLDATERKDRYAQLDLLRSAVVLHLRDDRIEDAAARLSEMDELLARYPVVALNHLVMAVNVSFQLYRGHVAAAKRRLATLWRECRQSGLHHLPLLRLKHLGMLADCTLADALLPERTRATHLSKLARAARKQPIEWAAALAKHLEGEALLLCRKAEPALRALDEAHDLYSAAGMPLTAACIRASQSACAPARRSEQLAEEANAFFAAQGIERPDRWRMLVHSVY